MYMMKKKKLEVRIELTISSLQERCINHCATRAVRGNRENVVLLNNHYFIYLVYLSKTSYLPQPFSRFVEPPCSSHDVPGVVFIASSGYNTF